MLSRNEKVAIIGGFANTPRYQCAGSSQVNPTKLDNLKDVLYESYLNITGFAKEYSRTNPKPDMELIAQAVQLAVNSDVVLLCVGLDEITESEGMDRLNMDLSEGQN